MLTMEVVTPERHVITIETEGVVVPAFKGYLGVLYNHAPLVSILKTGVVKYTVEGEQKKIALEGGFMEVADNNIVILADTAELAEDIDIARAIASKDRAERRLLEKEEKIDETRAHASLQRAKNRIEAA